MSVERWLQIHGVTLCLLGSLFIALNTGNLAVPLGVLLAGVTSILFTDTWKWFQLNRLLGNLAAVGAVVYALRDFLVSGSEGQLLAIASLLVYLQVILFYQAKTIRLYWQLILLSLLQVVVGAALHLGLSFGVLLLFYTVVAVSTLVLFFIHRETEQHVESLQKNQSVPKTPTPPELGRPARVLNVASRDELNHSFLTHSLVRQILLFTTGAMIFAAAFFYTVPRHSKAAWTGTRGFSQAETGFTRDVELQQMGQMLQNNGPVMRVWLVDSQGRHLPRMYPYFAGEVLTTYRPDDRQHASWIASSRASTALDRKGATLPVLPNGAIVQQTRMDATYHNSLFAITPIYSTLKTPQNIQVDPVSRLIFRQTDAEAYLAQDYYYEVATTGVRDGRQLAVTPNQRPYATKEDKAAVLRELEECKDFNQDQFPGITDTADKIVSKLGKAPTRFLIARALEEHFLAPGAYTYSLNLNVKRDPDLDPIEDFVTNHRTGHCQYFASALVMMLRSQGIPARMVVGYLGDEYNEVGHFYQVRQRNAHAWVEAYLSPDQVPTYEPTGGPIGPAGAWLRLDPTPGREGGDDFASLAGTTRDWLDYVDMIWTDYVIGLNQQRQQTTMYGAPTEEDALAETWLNPDRWTTFYTFAGWLGIHIKPAGDAGFRIKFDWRAGLTAMVLCGVAVALNRFARRYGRRFDWSALFGTRRPRGLRSRVEFYARLEELLARRGRSRRPAETAREYIDHAVKELAITRSDVLHQTVEAFYRVRFGEVELSNSERETIEQTLAELERTPTTETGLA